jgi:rSAM/selenodomain-associated transferase 2
MQLSIIIPTLNEARHIGRTLQHIQQHGGGQVAELLVVDGGSTDDTVRLAQGAGATVLRSPRKGRAAQLDYGARQCSGHTLYFVHADTLPPTTFRQDIERALAQGWQMGNFQYDFDSPRLLLRCNAYFTRYRWFFTQGGDRTFFIRRDTYFALGGYDPELPIMEEYDFLRRAQRAGYDFAMLPGKCLVSARKYERNSWLRVQLANLLVYNCWAWGLASPAALKALYGRVLG